MRTIIKGFISAAVGVAVATTSGGAVAQDATAGAGGLDEIVVTARKRVESIQDAPLTIQA